MNEFRFGDLDPRGSEELLKSFFAEAALGLSITDLRGRFLEVNQAYCSLTGYTEGELKARDFQSITHPDDLPRTMANIGALTSGKVSSYLIENRYVRKDEIVVWVLNTISVGRDKNGRPSHLISLSQDLTEQLQLEESLRRAEAHTESILASITDTHLVLDHHWRFLYVNDAAVRAIARPREQIIGQMLWNLYPDIVETEMGRQYRRAMDERVTVAFEFHYERLNTWWDTRFYPVPAGVAVFATDITERKHAEAALWKAERKYRDIFENAGEGIFQTTPEGKYIAANPALARMHGFASPEEFVSSRQDITREVYVDPGRRGEFKRLLEENGVVRGFEHEIYRRDGSRIWVSVNARAVRNEQRSVAYYEGTAQDITERKRSEEAQRVSERRYREIFDFAPVGIYQSRRDGSLITCNNTLAEMLGYESVDELLKVRLDRDVYWNSEDRERIIAEYADRAYAGDFEVQWKKKCGTPVWVQLTARAVKSTDGIDCFEGFVRDVTEQRRAEQALRESEERYRDLVQNSSELICTHDLNGLVLSANPAAAAAIGCDPDEFVAKKSIRDILAPEVRGQFDEYIARLRKDGTTSGIMLVQTISGETRIWEYRNSLRTDGVSAPIVRGMARDITEQTRAEKALRESEERFSKAFYSSPAPLIITRLVDGCFLNANDSFLRTFEYEREEVVGKTVHELKIYVDLGDRKKLIDRLKEEAALREYESRARTKSGRILDLLVFVEGVRLNGEECILSTAYDITERKRIEEALRESEERYRELFENARDAIYVHDLSGRYTSVNRAAERLSGFAREEILGKHFSNFVSPRYLKNARESLCRKLDQPGETTYEIDLITKDRQRVPVEVSSRMIYENGKPVAVQGVARDITDRQRAEEARAQLALIVESSEDAIISKTLDGTIVSWNSGAKKIYGYIAEEVIGCPIGILVPPDRSDEVPELLERVRRGESINHYETVRRRKDGGLIDVSLTVSPIRGPGGQLVGSSTIARDITSSKHAEKALKTFSRRLIEAQEAEREKIARELHDEIGQVLTAVRINLQAIQRFCEGDENIPRFDESIAIVDEALGRVRELSIELRPSLLDDLGLSAALRWYVDRYTQRTGIIAEVLNGFEQKRLPRELETACFRIAQEALTNVARHAQAASVSVQLEHSPEILALTVMDDGVGFDLGDLKKDVMVATALGLRGMEERALAVGGQFEIDSGSGCGTRVRAIFPLIRK